MRYEKWIFLLVVIFFQCRNLIAASQLMVSFDGKGVAMAWDIGVMKALNEKVRNEVKENVIFVGASSGSFLAAYFACHGLNSNSVATLEERAKTFPKEVLNEETTRRSIQLALDISPEVSLAPVKPLLDIATNFDTCVPKHPMLITTANLDVVEGRIPSKPFAGVRGRVFNQSNYVLSENGTVRGKVCTYFVNEPMAKLLAKIPSSERLCDLRLIRAPQDLRLAVIASISEPTYYATVPEPDLTKIESQFPLPKQRSYGGGFVMNSPIQDVKRAMPEIWVVGTGRVTYTRLQDRILKNWFTFPLNLTLLDQRWWFDEQVTLSRKMWDSLYEKKVTPTVQIALGYSSSMACLSGTGCLPKLFTRPHFFKDIYGHDLTAKRHRGIRPILK